MAASTNTSCGETWEARCLDDKRLARDAAHVERLEQLARCKHCAAPRSRLAPVRAMQVHRLRSQMQIRYPVMCHLMITACTAPGKQNKDCASPHDCIAPRAMQMPL